MDEVVSREKKHKEKLFHHPNKITWNLKPDFPMHLWQLIDILDHLDWE